MILYKTPLKLELLGRDLFVNDKRWSFSVRKIGEMKDVLMEPVYGNEWLPAYFMYREIYSTDNLRFDITLLPARMYGVEYNKTYGHYHPISKDGKRYPEVYHVLKGSAVFILQKENSDFSVNVVLVSGAEGECVIIPPDYGHVSVNIGDEILLLSNVVSKNFESEYEEYKKNHGAAYYYTEDGPVQNTYYVIKETKKYEARGWNKKYGFRCADLLFDFYTHPEKFAFLDKPSLFFK